MKYETVKIKKFFSQITAKVLPICLHYRNGYKSMNISQKADLTLLTDADIEIQATLVNLIKDFDRNAYIIAEENTNIANPLIEEAQSVWIIDPIDGTAQFAMPTAREFCIAVCKYEFGIPVAALIILPQLGFNLTPIIAEAFCEEKLILINDINYECKDDLPTKNISCTRSKNSNPHAFEEILLKKGYNLKTSTTSQSIDLLRTACSLTEYSDLNLPKFDFFYRKNQKIWDGAPGFCFNYIVGNVILNKDHKKLIPFNNSTLSANTPVNEEVFVCTKELLTKYEQK